MIKVAPLSDLTEEQFKKLFIRYYTELNCEGEPLHLAEEYVLPDLLAGLLHIDVLSEGDELEGFIIYQTDDIDNDWNFKEGWGDIREIFVVPDKRRQGLGRFLLYTAEMKLRESGTLKTYCLPEESASGFFAACGYKKTDDVCDELGCSVYEKTDLSNKCK